MHRGPGVDELFEDWQRLRDERQAASDELEEWIAVREEATRTWYRNSKRIIHDLSPFTAAGRRQRYAELDAEYAEKRVAEAQWVREQRRTVRAANPLPGWQDYLRGAASQGNGAALAALHRNANRYRRAVNAVMNGEDSEAARAAVIAELKPQALNDGSVVYRLRDGGKVVDSGVGSATVEKESPIALALTLALAASRSRDRCVVLTLPEWAQALIKVAARDKLDLHFDDPAHEQERQRLMAVFERQEAVMAATVFVALRNAARALQPEMPAHRLWSENGAGGAVFAGLEPLGEGAQALLLLKAEEMLVMPLTAAEAASMGEHEPGETVEVPASVRLAQKAAQR